jgi:hypothetical protein
MTSTDTPTIDIAGRTYRTIDHSGVLRIYGDFLGQAADTIDHVFPAAVDSVLAMQIGEHRRAEVNRPRSAARALLSLQAPDEDVRIDLDGIHADHKHQQWTTSEVSEVLLSTVLREDYVRTAVAAAIQRELGISI